MSDSAQLPYELLGKYFSGEASPEEAMAVDEWMHAHKDNRELYNQVAAVWDDAATRQRYQLPDKEKVLQEVRSRMTVEPKLHNISKTQYWRRIAAGLLVLAGAASLYFLQQQKKTDIIYVSRQTTTGIFRDTLPDRSIAVVNSNSAIKYITGLTGDTRAIELKGEAWFDVTTDPAKPFIITVGGINIKVLGTSFNVKESADGVNVAVKTGAVMLSRNDSSLVVKAGQQGVYNKAQQQFVLAGAANNNTMGYATRVFNFNNATLKEITGELEKAYGIQVIFENKNLENCTMSSSFDNKPIQYVFEVISVTLNVQCRFENDRVYVSGAGCN